MLFRRSWAAFEPFSLPCPAQMRKKEAALCKKIKFMRGLAFSPLRLRQSRIPGKRKKHRTRWQICNERGNTRIKTKANDRLTAVGSKPGGLLMWDSYTPVGEIAFGKVSRAPPCTRKGHRPLTRINAKLSFCLCWVRVRLSANNRLTVVERKPGGLLRWGSYTPVGGNCLPAIVYGLRPAPARDIVP